MDNGQNVETLQGTLALDEAAELVRRGEGAVKLGDGSAALSSEEFQEIKAKARRMIATGGLDKINRGAEDARKLAFVSGSPVPFVLFEGLVENGRASPQEKEAFRKRLARFMRSASGVAGWEGRGPDARTVGCMKVDFTDAQTRQPNTAYMLLGECPRDHDLSAQLAIIYDRIDPDYKQTVLNHLSLLVCCGRNAYGEMLMKNAGWVTEALQKGAHPGSLDPRALRIDRENTTFYLDPEWKKRVGIFIQLESEVLAQRPLGEPSPGKPSSGGTTSAD